MHPKLHQKLTHYPGTSLDMSSGRTKTSCVQHQFHTTFGSHQNRFKLETLICSNYHPEKPLKVGEELKLHCETSGSRPPAKISWWMDNIRIQSGKESIRIAETSRTAA
ncbi:hypothetical protein CEXT_356931 [Caerostris extrusa]|uniref:Ig-like domain-containing protein n=1 Tax=Caerostris extrusa TaxID=172846 RepID=A0AAV4SS88_CAEEX|nr:hypothetical protein CEXT_356931 [Caerostris extrusa]